MNLKNLHNVYQDNLGRVFDDTPKAVFAAIAASAYEQGGTAWDDIASRIAHEWCCLYDSGVLHNRPTKHVREVARKSDPFRE
jgi:hypothetical protein